MEREHLLHMKEQLEKALEKAGTDSEALGRVLGQLGKVKMELGMEDKALAELLASQILLVSTGFPQAATVENWIAILRKNMGEERFLEAFHKALPQAGFTLVQYMGREKAERAMEEFARIKGKSRK